MIDVTLVTVPLCHPSFHTHLPPSASTNFPPSPHTHLPQQAVLGRRAQHIPSSRIKTRNLPATWYVTLRGRRRRSPKSCWSWPCRVRGSASPGSSRARPRLSAAGGLASENDRVLAPPQLMMQQVTGRAVGAYWIDGLLFVLMVMTAELSLF